MAVKEQYITDRYAKAQSNKQSKSLEMRHKVTYALNCYIDRYVCLKYSLKYNQDLTTELCNQQYTRRLEFLVNNQVVKKTQLDMGLALYWSEMHGDVVFDFEGHTNKLSLFCMILKRSL